MCVNDGLDIIRFFLNYEKKNLIKLIITDENMDYFNGSEAIKFIRKIEKLKNLPRINIISLSCHEDNLMTGMIIDSGADLILSKPLSRELLKSFMQKIKILSYVSS